MKPKPGRGSISRDAIARGEPVKTDIQKKKERMMNPETSIAIRILHRCFQEGSYAAVSGAPRENPSNDHSCAEAWFMGFDTAEKNRQQSLDPFGKPPGIPKLCARDVRKVCNCADSTRAACLLPQYPPPKPRFRDIPFIARSKAIFWKYFNKGAETRAALHAWLSDDNDNDWES